MRKRLSIQGGFTLLELLMVVIIIAILAAIALPQYLRVAEKSRSGEALTLMASIRSSEGRYRAADPNGQYTTDLSLLDVELPNVTAGPGGASTTANWSIVVNGSDPLTGPNTVATRSGGSLTGSAIDMDLNTGETCAPAPANQIWGLALGGSTPNCP